jgi:hypothetical protein
MWLTGNVMKWMKWLVLFVVGLVLVLGLALLGAYVYGVRGTPDWLRPSTATAEERAAAANRVDQKIIDALSYVREMDTYHVPSPTTDVSDRRPAASQPASRLEVSFTEDELNASFQKWNQLYGWTERYRDYIQDPTIVLHEGRIILAGKSEEVGTLVSLHFTPELDKSGRLNLALSRVLAGRLPLPQAFFEKYRTATQTRLQSALPDLQRKAALNKDGSANVEAMSAAMAKLFLHVLANEPGDPVLFLPVGNKRSVPVRLTDVKIEDKALSLTVKPLNATERVALLGRIRERLDKETAMSAEPAVAPGRNNGS